MFDAPLRPKDLDLTLEAAGHEIDRPVGKLNFIIYL